MSKLSLALPRKEVNLEDLSKLFLYKLPMSIPDIVYKNRGKVGSTVAIFESTKEADSAFEHLKGGLGKDSGGYPQKSVTLTYPARNQMRMAEFLVRKMLNFIATGPASEELQVLSSSSKRVSVGDENIVVAKCRRISSDSAGDLDCSTMVTTEPRNGGVNESQTQEPLMSST